MFNPTLLFAVLTAFVVTLVSIQWLAGPARRWNLIDHPDSRKQHKGSVPLTGGIAIVLGVAAAAWMLPGPWLPQWTLGAGALVLLVIGVLDDRYELRASPRLLAQFTVAMAMVLAGIQVFGLGNLLGLGDIGLGLFSAPLTILAVALMVNAINMMDGMDGLAGSVGWLALGGLAILAFDVGETMLGSLALLVIAALTGFLVMNLRFGRASRARAFLGDSGSMPLGYALAWFGVSLAGSGTTVVAPITVAWLLLLPAADCLAVFFRRLSGGRNPLAPDRTHLHHIFLRAGFSVRQTWSILILNQLLLVSIGVAGHLLGWPQPLQFFLAAAMMLGYLGFSLSSRRFLRTMARRHRPIAGTEGRSRPHGGQGPAR